MQSAMNRLKVNFFATYVYTLMTSHPLPHTHTLFIILAKIIVGRKENVLNTFLMHYQLCGL